ncbi:MAG: tetratricopeptide repeat protein, partial [Methylococcales bacterium]
MKITICDWNNLDSYLTQLIKKIERGEKTSSPFPMFAMSSSVALQKKAAEIFSQAKHPSHFLLPPLIKHAHSKIKIGYFSSDFRQHAVSYLIAELFERHDRSRFEIIAFSFHAARNKDDMRLRLEAAFDQFIDVSEQSDEQVVRLARKLEIDIAVDLNGYTGGCRTDIFAMRAAPIQVNYIGYLGTMGADYIDYLLADSVLIPTEHQAYYSEKIVYLPNSFQVNDSTLSISNKVITRAEFGLPEQGFVFCCFNNHFKITSTVFKSWMRILRHVEGSVLWLFCGNIDAETNLRLASTAQGINADRLIFANALPKTEHLARYRLADLFLDTRPCNAGATASDALWAGLPIITYLGETFPSRMAASLLNAVGLPELITNNADDYEALAIKLATHSEQLAALKQKLADNRLTMPLFNTKLFTQHIESAFQMMFDRYQAGFVPDHIYVPAQITEQPVTQNTENLELFDSTIVMNLNAIEKLINHGNELEDLGRFDDALASYDRALSINPDYARAHSNRGNVLQSLKRFDDAITSYNRALVIKPDYAEAFCNRGNALQALSRIDEALSNYDKALAIKPNLWLALIGRGTVLQNLNRYQEMLSACDQLLAIQPDSIETLINRGNVLQIINRFDDALSSYERALTLKPNHQFLLGTWLHNKMRLCDWSDFDTNLEQLIKKITLGVKASTPFPVLALTSSAAIQQTVARYYVQEKYPSHFLLPPLVKHAHSKIKLAYFSADFRIHATTQLIAELFDRHDRSRFEIIAFSFHSASHKDVMRLRLETAFDQFIDVSQQSDEQVVRLARQLEIDIAVDLKGFTEDARPNIFAMRAAPIQVSYLGYPTTMGADYIDYLLADSVLIPKEYQHYYTEFCVYLPNSYQVNDTSRVIANRQFTRAELGLPEQGFVFCCFNNNYKITPVVFDCWMRILHHVEGSVLWLLEDNATAARNLRLAATARGINAERIVFAQRLALPEHLARHRLADLFLDTLPCNAHTTTSDALWAGLPVLTCMGETFASRVAASLLNAIGLPELITSNHEDYEALAIQLATHPEQLASLKQKLADNRLTTPLFNTALFTQHIESAFQMMFDRYQADLTPDHIYVSVQVDTTKPIAEQHELDALIDQGNELEDLNRLEDALASYDKALSINPNYARAHSNRGNVLQSLNRFEDALKSYGRALAIRPEYAEAFYNRGNALQAIKDLSAAIASYEQALRIKPYFLQALVSLGNALHDTQRYTDALLSYDKALAIQPDYAEAFYNCGNVLHDLKRYEDAIESYNRALAIHPDYAGAHWNVSFCYLILGDFEAGWQNYEWRWQTDGFKNAVRHFHKPQWFGESSLQGKTIFLYGEQGIGDILHFCRYVKLLADLGAKVILEAPKTLSRLLANLEGVDQLIVSGDTLPDFDFYSPLLSLPLAFKTRLDSIPANTPYLFSEPDKVKHWQAILGEKTMPRVGIVWSGNPAQKSDYRRSLSLRELLPLFAPPLHCQFISLQKELRDADKELLAQQPVLQQYGELINDFTDTAALCELMDVVISVCTSVAHLSGAMGKPTWILLSDNACWRWLLNREDSPWYPTARLFRQTQYGDWQSVIELVKHDLISVQSSKVDKLDSAPPNNPAKFALAMNLHQQGQLAAAETLYEEILQTEPQHVDALHFLGVLKNQNGQPQLAVDLIQQSLDININNSAAYSNLGTVFQALNRVDDALICYDKVLELSPDSVDALLSQANLLQTLNRPDEALISYNRALTIKPDFIDALIGRGSVLQILNRFDEAVINYDLLLSIDTHHAEALFGQANTLYKLKRLEEALTSYNRSLAINPNSFEALYNRGVVLADLNRVDEAIVSYQDTLAINPDYAEVHNNLGILLKNQYRYLEAEASYRRAIEIKLDYSEAHCNLITLLKDQGHLSQAEISLQTALMAIPNSIELHFIQLIMSLPVIPKSAAASVLVPSQFDEALTNLSNWINSSASHQESLNKAGLLPLPFLLAYRVGNHVQRLSRYGDL